MPVHRSRLGDSCAPNPDDEFLLEFGWPVNDRPDSGYWELIGSVMRMLPPESLEEELRAVQLIRTALIEWLLSDTPNDEFDDAAGEPVEADSFVRDEQFQFNDSAFVPLLSPDDADVNETEPSYGSDGAGNAAQPPFDQTAAGD
jgi:hypothetical protein